MLTIRPRGDGAFNVFRDGIFIASAASRAEAERLVEWFELDSV